MEVRIDRPGSTPPVTAPQISVDSRSNGPVCTGIKQFTVTGGEPPRWTPSGTLVWRMLSLLLIAAPAWGLDEPTPEPATTPTSAPATRAEDTVGSDTDGADTPDSI